MQRHEVPLQGAESGGGGGWGQTASAPPCGRVRGVWRRCPVPLAALRARNRECSALPCQETAGGARCWHRTRSRPNAKCPYPVTGDRIDLLVVWPATNRRGRLSGLSHHSAGVADARLPGQRTSMKLAVETRPTVANRLRPGAGPFDNARRYVVIPACSPARGATPRLSRAVVLDR